MVKAFSNRTNGGWSLEFREGFQASKLSPMEYTIFVHKKRGARALKQRGQSFFESNGWGMELRTSRGISGLARDFHGGWNLEPCEGFHASRGMERRTSRGIREGFSWGMELRTSLGISCLARDFIAVECCKCASASRGISSVARVEEINCETCPNDVCAMQNVRISRECATWKT